MPESVEKLHERLEELTLALRLSEARFLNAVTGNTDGLIIVDQEGAVLCANPAAADFLVLRVPLGISGSRLAVTGRAP